LNQFLSIADAKVDKSLKFARHKKNFFYIFSRGLDYKIIMLTLQYQKTRWNISAYKFKRKNYEKYSH